MTSYLASAGVQQVSITIASGQTTGTATINAVGAGAFIVGQGETTTDSTTAASALARLTLTNSTTVTATRNTASTDTVTINCAVVDADTTNLVKTVQFGTVTIATAATSGTASISAVTNANTAIFFLGTSTASTLTLTRDAATVSLSGTTVTAARSASTGASVVAFCVVEFQGAALQSATQQVSIATAAGTSFPSTITGVSVANTMLAYGGTTDAISTTGNRDFGYGELTNSTTLTAKYNSSVGAGGTYNCTVIEFIPSIFTIQRGTISIAAGTSNTKTVTSSPAASTLCNWLGNKTDQSGAGFNANICKITQTNDTTLTMSVNTSASPVGSYELIGFFPPPPAAQDLGWGASY